MKDRFATLRISPDEDGDSRAGVIYMPDRKRNPIKSISYRFLIALGCLVFTSVLVWIERKGYIDNVSGKPIDFLDAFYYASVTLSTTGYGDITPVSPLARFITTVVVTPIRFIFLFVLIGTTIQVLTRRSREQWRQLVWRQKMHNHIIVVGSGVKGRSAVNYLLDRGISANEIVVVSQNAAEVAEAARNGIVGIAGDATREDVLNEARITEAKQIVVATDRDDTALLVTLTARRMAPKINIIASAREAQNVPVLRQSGADSIIPTAESSGQLLALSLLSPSAGQLMEDLLDPSTGLQLVERDITREELGLTPADLRKENLLVMGVVRNGELHRFDRKPIDRLERGDRLVVVQGSPLVRGSDSSASNG